MTVTNVKRTHGAKAARRKKSEEESGPAEEVDEDEEKYCICDGISEGSMILCDNHVSRLLQHLRASALTILSARRNGFISRAWD